MPHGKEKQVTRKNPREEDFELEVDPTASEDTLSPLYSAGSSASSDRSGSSVSSEQLRMILAANSKAMESSMLAMLATLTPTISASSVAPTPAVASRPSVKVPKWTDGDQPFTFFTKLETALTYNGVDRATWGSLLPVYLSGRAEIAFAQVDPTLLGDYDSVKSVLLKALGDTPAHADRNWWSLARLSGETPADFYLRIRNTGLRRFCELPSREAVIDHVILSRFLSLLHADSYSAVMSQHPKTGLEAAELLQNFEETRAYSWKRQSWKTSHSGRREPGRGGSSLSSDNYGGRNHSPTHSGKSSISSSSNSSDGSGSSPSEGTGDNFDSGAPASGGFERNGGRGSRRPVICHNCGEPGHIRPDCPNRIRSIRSLGSTSGFVVTGFVAGFPVKGMKIDTGADRTIIDAKHIPRSAYLGKTITLDTWKGRQYSKHPLAKLSIEIGGVSTVAVVAVGENFDSSALLGRDLGPAMTAKLASIMVDSANATLSSSELEVPMQMVIVEPDEVFDVTVEPLSEIDSESDSDVTAVPKQSEDIVVTKQHVELEVVSTTRAQSECNSEALAVVLDVPEAYSEPDVVFETQELINELEIDQNFPEDDDTSVALGDVFDFSDTLFCDDSPVDLGDVFNFSDSLFDPEDPVPTPVSVLEVCPIDEASSSYFGGDSDGYDSLVGLGDVLDLVDQLFVPVQPVPSPGKILEVLPVGRIDIECPLPVLEEVVVVKCEEAYVAPVVEVAVEQFAVVESLGGEAPVPVINNFKFSDEFFYLADDFFEQEPVLSPDPVMQLMPAKAFINLTLTEEVLLSTSRCQSSDLANFIKYFLRFQIKATRRLAPGRDSVSTLLLCFCLRILLFVLFCCSSILLVLVQVVALFHRACFLGTLPAGCQKLLLPMRVLLLYPCLRQTKGGEMLWSLLPNYRTS